MEKARDYITSKGWKNDLVKTKHDLEGVLGGIIDLYYGNSIVKMNANIIASQIPGIIAASGVSGFMEGNNYYHFSEKEITGVAAASDWLAVTGVQFLLHLFSNKEKFTDKNYNGEPEFNTSGFAMHLGHTYLTQLPATLAAYGISMAGQYFLMKHGIGAFGASQISYSVGVLAGRVIHTGIGLKTGLFDKKKELKSNF